MLYVCIEKLAHGLIRERGVGWDAEQAQGVLCSEAEEWERRGYTILWGSVEEVVILDGTKPIGVLQIKTIEIE